MRGEDLGQLVAYPLAFAVEVVVHVGRELAHRGQACGHAKRVAVVGSALRDVGMASWVEQLHHVAAPAERGHRQPAADDLAQGRQVRGDAIPLLGAPWRDAKRDDLVEDQEDAELQRHISQPPEELRRGGDHASRSDDRFEDDGGQPRALAADDPLRRVGVVEREDDHLLQRPLRRPDRVRARSRVFRRPRLRQRGMRAHLGVVVGAVIATFDARDLRSASEGASKSNREHRRLGPRAAESNRIEAGHAPAEELRELDLHRVRGGEARPPRRLITDRLEDLRMRVAEDHRRVVADHVDALDAVNVPDAAAFAALDVERIGVEVGRGASRAAWHRPGRAIVQRTRARCRQPVCSLGVDHCG